jgi:putative N6-adenine-specific DNA methylase
LATNPPYGDRMEGGGQKGMKSFYFKLGDNLTKYQGWRFAVLSGNPAFESAFHAHPTSRRRLWNGPIECELLCYPARFPVRPAAEGV